MPSPGMREEGPDDEGPEINNQESNANIEESGGRIFGSRTDTTKILLPVTALDAKTSAVEVWKRADRKGEVEGGKGKILDDAIAIFVFVVGPNDENIEGDRAIKRTLHGIGVLVSLFAIDERTSATLFAANNGGHKEGNLASLQPANDRDRVESSIHK